MELPKFNEDAPPIRTVKEAEGEIQTLRKENFDLRLRIYYLEKRIRDSAQNESDQALQERIVEQGILMEEKDNEIKARTELLSTAREHMAKLREENATLKATTDNLGSPRSIQFMRKDLQRKEEVISQTSKREQDLQREIQKLNGQLDRYEREVAERGHLHLGREKEHEEAISENTRLREQLANLPILHQQIDQLNIALENCKHESNRNSDLARDMETECQRIAEAYRDASERLQTVQSQNAEVNGLRTSLREAKAVAASERKARVEAETEAKERMLLLEDATQTLECLDSRLSSEAGGREAEKNVLEGQLSRLQSQLNEARNHLRQVPILEQRLDQQVRENSLMIQQLNDQHESELRSMKSRHEAALLHECRLKEISETQLLQFRKVCEQRDETISRRVQRWHESLCNEVEHQETDWKRCVREFITANVPGKGEEIIVPEVSETVKSQGNKLHNFIFQDLKSFKEAEKSVGGDSNVTIDQLIRTRAAFSTTANELTTEWSDHLKKISDQVDEKVKMLNVLEKKQEKLCRLMGLDEKLEQQLNESEREVVKLKDELENKTKELEEQAKTSASLRENNGLLIMKLKDDKRFALEVQRQAERTGAELAKSVAENHRINDAHTVVDQEFAKLKSQFSNMESQNEQLARFKHVYDMLASLLRDFQSAISSLSDNTSNIAYNFQQRLSQQFREGFNQTQGGLAVPDWAMRVYDDVRHLLDVNQGLSERLDAMSSAWERSMNILNSGRNTTNNNSSRFGGYLPPSSGPSTDTQQYKPHPLQQQQQQQQQSAYNGGLERSPVHRVQEVDHPPHSTVPPFTALNTSFISVQTDCNPPTEIDNVSMRPQQQAQQPLPQQRDNMYSPFAGNNRQTSQQVGPPPHLRQLNQQQSTAYAQSQRSSNVMRDNEPFVSNTGGMQTPTKGSHRMIDTSFGTLNQTSSKDLRTPGKYNPLRQQVHKQPQFAHTRDGIPPIYDLSLEPSKKTQNVPEPTPMKTLKKKTSFYNRNSSNTNAGDRNVSSIQAGNYFRSNLRR